jgi:hypothetical protein
MNLLPKKLSLAVDVCALLYHKGIVQREEMNTALSSAPRYLEFFLQELVKAEVITSRRGPRGGYKLDINHRLDNLAILLGYSPNTALGNRLWDELETLHVKDFALEEAA